MSNNVLIDGNSVPIALAAQGIVTITADTLISYSAIKPVSSDVEYYFTSSGSSETDILPAQTLKAVHPNLRLKTNTKCEVW